ncbi:HAD-IIA family hydrolase [Gellertiella hungarica]|uniref:HAD superfamily hydrolase (TIGR01450 family) n=1 Tax=Gellertiella hungarica TaxID=1572859 RepID=A0A7W6J2S2_9HYPH|nr:HAD-IIA family hydrolase [Gellertiella hungarica]MBB4063721.1 HAD superfamily hydrolase (TIGR01450 family) [Gellertiella hungarica]
MTSVHALPIPDGQDPLAPAFDSDTAFKAYEAVRGLLPEARFKGAGAARTDLGALVDEFDMFVFDAFGVLNVGDTPIPGAVERVRMLRARGKTCVVVTNAASYDPAASLAKFTRLGFDFPSTDIATSRQAAEEAAIARGANENWAVLGMDAGEAGALPFQPLHPGDDAELYDRAEGFLFLSNLRWTAHRQALLEATLTRRSRPVIIANPDIIAPREGGLSTEPGYFGYRLAKLGLGSVEFHGKPFPSVYDLVRRTHPAARDGRICMVGDTLHTDVLGGAAAGWGTVLVSDHGLFKGVDVREKIAACGIVPDYIVPAI